MPDDIFVTIPDVEVFKAGVHNGDAYTVADLEQMVTASQQIGFTPPLKLGHMLDSDTDALLKHEGLPAFGFVKNLRVRGKALVADFTNIPRRLRALIRQGLYPNRSEEIWWGYQKNGKVWPKVLKAVALLGSSVPAITDLASIEALFTDGAVGDTHYVVFTEDLNAAPAAQAGRSRQEIPMANDLHATTQLDHLVKEYQEAHPEYQGKYKEAMTIVLNSPKHADLKARYLLERTV